MVLYNAFVLSWGLTITQNSIHTISDLDRSRLSDTRSAENDWIGADTDPEYRIDASLIFRSNCVWRDVRTVDPATLKPLLAYFNSVHSELLTVDCGALVISQ